MPRSRAVCDAASPSLPAAYYSLLTGLFLPLALPRPCSSCYSCYVQSAVPRNYSEKSINNLMDLVATGQQVRIKPLRRSMGSISNLCRALFSSRVSYFFWGGERGGAASSLQRDGLVCVRGQLTALLCFRVAVTWVRRVNCCKPSTKPHWLHSRNPKMTDSGSKPKSRFDRSTVALMAPQGAR